MSDCRGQGVSRGHGSQPGTVLPLQGHCECLDSFLVVGCHMGLGAEGVLPASNGQRPGMLVKHLTAQSTVLTAENCVSQDVSSAKAENT